MHALRLSLIAALLLTACTGKDGVLTEILQPESTSDTTEPTTEPTDTDETDPQTTGEAAQCADNQPFQDSLAIWQATLAESGPDYFYTVIRGPGGFNDSPHCDYRTLTAVSAGVVIERRYEVSLKVGDEPCDEPWTETGAAIGTHTDLYALPPATMDGLYTACCEDALQIQPADEYTPNLEVDDAGLMKSCYAYMNGCGEGCDEGPYGRGLFLESLEFGAPPAP